jgi:hypothetical protein
LSKNRFANCAKAPADGQQQSRHDRARQIQVEVANARLHGLEPISEYFEIADRYVAGELTLEQFSAAVQKLSHPRRSDRKEAGKTKPADEKS